MRLIPWLVALSLLVATGCGAQESAPATGASPSGAGSAGSGSEGSGSEGSGSEGSGSSVIGTGKQADLDFTATALDGSRFEGASLEGTTSVLWFWAPWCPTCRAQIVNVSALAQEYDGRVAVVGVGGLDDATEIEGLAADIPHVTHLVDDAGVVWRQFGVTAQSTYTVISEDGEIVSEGYLDDGDLNDLVAALAAGT